MFLKFLRKITSLFFEKFWKVRLKWRNIFNNNSYRLQECFFVLPGSQTLFFNNVSPGSMLHAMFSGRFDTKPNEDGSYFIDRDGTHFRYILNYLRSGQLIVPQDELVRIREELLAEAEFYQVEGMIKALKRKPEPKPQPKPQPKPFADSVILSSDQSQTLINWLKETWVLTNVSGNLLYRASRNGWAASNFHSCCDNNGPTVTVVKSGNYIFGGYTDKLWDGRSYSFLSQ